MTRRTIFRILVGSVSAGVFTVILLFVVYIPWALDWGATDAEIGRQMPGDELVPEPTFVATRGVTIRGRPEEIWPWIIQIGYRRAGFYSWDRLDNDGIASAEQIITEYQNLELADSIPLSRDAGGRVVTLEPNRSMLLVVESDLSVHGPWTWAWGLYKEDSAHTRLVTRLRVRHDSWRTNLVLKTLEIVMMRKHMLGIKRRVEARS